MIIFFNPIFPIELIRIWLPIFFNDFYLKSNFEKVGEKNVILLLDSSCLVSTKLKILE